MSTDSKSHTSLFLRHPLIILFGTFLALYLSVLLMFVKEGHPKTVMTNIEKSAPHFDVHLLNVDLVRDLATFTFAPDMTSPDIAVNGRLITDMVAEVDTGVSVLTHTFKKGDAPAPWSAVVPIENGDTSEYPFDKYTGAFLFKVKHGGNPSTLARVDLDKVLHGFTASAALEPTADGAQVVLKFEFSRSPAVVFLALMALTSLTMVVLSAVSVAKHVAINGRKVEFGMLVWIAALLFVIPAVRNGLPGSPPLGSLVDVALFFWLHILGVGSLLTVVYRWTKQT